jgi:hypothetical protein
MTFGEYGAGVVLLMLSSMALFSRLMHWEGFVGWPIITGVAKTSGGVSIAILLVICLLVAIEVKRDSPWSHLPDGIVRIADIWHPPASPSAISLSAPPKFAFMHTPVTPPPARKVIAPKLEEFLIAKGLEEPPGAPNGGGDNSKWLKEEERLNRMSLAQMRDLVAGNIERLKEFGDKWSYPAPEGLDGPPITAEPTPPEQLQAYQEELARKNQLEQEIRPAKRFKDFQKQFPALCRNLKNSSINGGFRGGDFSVRSAG